MIRIGCSILLLIPPRRKGIPCQRQAGTCCANAGVWGKQLSFRVSLLPCDPAAETALQPLTCVDRLFGTPVKSIFPRMPGGTFFPIRQSNLALPLNLYSPDARGHLQIPILLLLLLLLLLPLSLPLPLLLPFHYHYLERLRLAMMAGADRVEGLNIGRREDLDM